MNLDSVLVKVKERTIVVRVLASYLPACDFNKRLMKIQETL